ncbi:hypothetical protein HYFRA_00008428, partial [Hymenoscyphus fraxineus]
MPALRTPLQYLIKTYSGHPLRLFTVTLRTVLTLHLFVTHGYGYSTTWGASMLPTFEILLDGLLVSKYHRRGRGIEVGDVITFDSVVEPGQKVIKRVLGMEGDYVMRDTPGSGSLEMLQVPKGHCWVIGDNLPASRDSRHFGPMPMALIRGKVIAKVQPFSERKWVTNGLTPVIE